jgi:DNA-binding NtrC family response regulator
MNVFNILVVDDDIGVCRIIQRMLADEQCRVVTSHSVADALEAIEEKPFDVYVADYKLRDGSGLDIAQRIRSKWGLSPIILISGGDPSVVVLRAEKFGIADFIEKPFSQETICMAVKRAIASLPAIPSAATAKSERRQSKTSFWQAAVCVMRGKNPKLFRDQRGR